jgi:Uncharacterised protein family (UPF0158)
VLLARAWKVTVAHDEWRAALRINRADPAALATILADLPGDGLQHAGDAILAHLDDAGLHSIAGRLVTALLDRDWTGDPELADAIQCRLDGRQSELTLVPVNLEELGEALGSSYGVESLLNIETGMVWPGELLDHGQEPDGYDPDEPSGWVTLIGLGSGAAYRDMERFAAAIDEPVASAVLETALDGKGAFRRFRNALDRHPEHLTAWHRFSDDSRMGRARAWLADQGCRPANG